MAGASGRSISATQAPIVPGCVPDHFSEPRARRSASDWASVQAATSVRTPYDRPDAPRCAGAPAGHGTMTAMSVPSVAPPRGALTALGEITPTRQEFRELARERRVIPVTRRLLADALTPVGLYATLGGDRSGTFLLESAENGHSWSRWSFVGVSASTALTERDGVAHWLGEVPVGLPTGGDPLQVLAETLRLLHTDPLDGLPPLTGGMVGYLGYDIVRRLERIGGDRAGEGGAVDELGVPELVMLLATD